ncbi:alcohol dehydrogenase [Camillea tinctor]|nr:alcohol dehydrogenase [Camillea tinctor]
MDPSLPKTYKAALFEKPNGPLVIRDLELKPPGPDQVLVRVLACGVCHTDMLVREGVMGVRFPRVPGHELVGDVVAVGDNAGRFSVGERVGGAWHGGHDGTCRACARGQFNVCDAVLHNGLSFDGGYAQFALLRAEAVVRVPRALDPADAAPLLCAGVTVFNAIRKMRVEQGSLVAVLGVGGLGHLAVQYARRMGYRVAAVSSGDAKRGFATELGANVYIDASQEDVPQRLMDIDGGAAMILATAPSPRFMGPMVSGLQAGGKLVAVAPVKNAEFNTGEMINRGASLHGFPAGHALDAEEAIRFAQENGIKCLVERFPLEEAERAFERCGSGDVRFRAVLTM